MKIPVTPTRSPRLAMKGITVSSGSIPNLWEIKAMAIVEEYTTESSMITAMRLISRRVRKGIPNPRKLLARKTRMLTEIDETNPTIEAAITLLCTTGLLLRLSPSPIWKADESLAPSMLPVSPPILIREGIRINIAGIDIRLFSLEFRSCPTRIPITHVITSTGSPR